MADAAEMTPSPPIWISRRITACPNSDQYVAVSCTMSPVTQTAEVAVNRALGKLVTVPADAETGSISSRLPSKITARNPSRIT